MTGRALTILSLWAMSAIGIVTPFKAEAEDLIPKGAFMTLEKCIEITLQKHPNIVAAAHTVKIGQARVGQAKADYYPQVSAAAGYRRLSSDSERSTGITDTSDTSDQYSGSLSLTQNIYDFGKRPTQVEIQDLNLDASLSDLADVSDQLIFNVKQAYFGVLQAQHNRDVSVETVRQFEQHREQAKGFYEVGTKPKFDLTKAEVDLSNAKLDLIRAENTLKIAKANLNNAMGLPDAPEYTIEDNLSFREYHVTFEDAIQRAYATRPDLRSVVARRTAAERSIDLAMKGHYPDLTGSASYTWTGDRFPLDRGWNVGASLSFPLFSGFETYYQVEASRNGLNVSRADEALLRQNIFLEIQQSYLNLQEAKERIAVAELAVRQAEENFEITQGRYAAGIGHPIEITDAEVALSEAKTAHIQALYDY
ncbi:MAG: TolC family protein [Nitrospirae bacterium]|nr:TolC family protein [Nitrospirota bacterium]